MKKARKKVSGKGEALVGSNAEKVRGGLQLKRLENEAEAPKAAPVGEGRRRHVRKVTHPKSTPQES